jgi:hypothetical protein
VAWCVAWLVKEHVSSANESSSHEHAVRFAIPETDWPGSWGPALRTSSFCCKPRDATMPVRRGSMNLARPKERCWSSVEHERPCAASAPVGCLANELPVWRNVGLGNTSQSFSRSSDDACDCLPERGITVIAWRVQHGSHLTLPILTLVEAVDEVPAFADLIHRFMMDPDTLPTHYLHG